MKQQDIATIILVVGVSVVVSLFAGKAIFVPPKDRQQAVEVVQPITADFPQPDSQFFNKTSLDPTKTIDVNQNTNSNPFGGH